MTGHPRLKAFVIDAVIIAFLAFAVVTVVTMLLPLPTLADPRLAWGGLGAAVLVGWLYHATLESSPVRATVGKALWRLHVTTPDGERLSFLRATLRFLLRPLGLATVLCGRPGAWTDAPHDRLSRTRIEVQTASHLNGL